MVSLKALKRWLYPRWRKPPQPDKNEVSDNSIQHPATGADEEIDPLTGHHRRQNGNQSYDCSPCCPPITEVAIAINTTNAGKQALPDNCQEQDRHGARKAPLITPTMEISAARIRHIINMPTNRQQHRVNHAFVTTKPKATAMANRGGTKQTSHQVKRLAMVTRPQTRGRLPRIGKPTAVTRSHQPSRRTMERPAKVNAITDNHKSAGLRSISRMKGPRSQKTCMVRSQPVRDCKASPVSRIISCAVPKPFEITFASLWGVLAGFRNTDSCSRSWLNQQVSRLAFDPAPCY